MDRADRSGRQELQRHAVVPGPRRKPIVERSSFLFYGASFATLLELPETPDHSVPMVAQLPMRYVPVFTKGCISSMLSGVAVRIQARSSARTEDRSSTSSVHSLEPRCEPSAALCTRRVQLPPGRWTP
jgi:hypothetical protein